MTGDKIIIFRINRYIMECKLIVMPYRSSINFLELIDTLWNVNKYKGKSKSLVDARINRYIMECK